MFTKEQMCSGQEISDAIKTLSEFILWVGWLWIIVIAAFLLAAIIFFVQIGDLLAPTGISIHQLITDIRGD